jgi:hypothetical protein
MDEELDKCDLLCNECHDVETSKQLGTKQYVHGTMHAYKWGKCRCVLCKAANAAQRRRERDSRLAA